MHSAAAYSTALSWPSLFLFPYPTLGHLLFCFSLFIIFFLILLAPLYPCIAKHRHASVLFFYEGNDFTLLLFFCYFTAILKHVFFFIYWYPQGVCVSLPILCLLLFLLPSCSSSVCHASLANGPGAMVQGEHKGQISDMETHGTMGEPGSGTRYKDIFFSRGQKIAILVFSETGVSIRIDYQRASIPPFTLMEANNSNNLNE